MSVRDAMIESWGITDELDEVAETEDDVTTTTAVDDDDDDDGKLVESDTETELFDHSVQSDCDEGC